VKCADDVHPRIVRNDADPRRREDLAKAYRPISSSRHAWEPLAQLLRSRCERSHDLAVPLPQRGEDLTALRVDDGQAPFPLDPRGEGGQRRDGMDREAA
jgi:hypothetical protein